MESRYENSKIKDIVDDLEKRFKDSVLPKLSNITDETKRYAFFIAWLCTELEYLGIGKIIVTGGFAVELYTGRTYRTMDVDLITENKLTSQVVEEFLSRFSERIGRGYLPLVTALSIKSIDIVATTYVGNRKPVKLLVNSYALYLVPPEDLIVIYLNGWKYWSSTEDRDKALWLYVIWYERLDHEYLMQKAKENNVVDVLKKLEVIVKSLR